MDLCWFGRLSWVRTHYSPCNTTAQTYQRMPWPSVWVIHPRPPVRRRRITRWLSSSHVFLKRRSPFRFSNRGSKDKYDGNRSNPYLHFHFDGRRQRSADRWLHRACRGTQGVHERRLFVRRGGFSPPRRDLEIPVPPSTQDSECDLGSVSGPFICPQAQGCPGDRSGPRR